METQSIPCIVEKHYLDTVTQALAHCNAGAAVGTLKLAISSGFEDIANVPLRSGKFKHHDLSRGCLPWGKHWLISWYTPNLEESLSATGSVCPIWTLYTSSVPWLRRLKPLTIVAVPSDISA